MLSVEKMSLRNFQINEKVALCLSSKKNKAVIKTLEAYRTRTLVSVLCAQFDKPQ